MSEQCILLPVGAVKVAIEAFDRIWQNANVSEAARKDAEAGIKALQQGKLFVDVEEARA